MLKYEQFGRMEKEFENQQDKSIKISNKIFETEKKKPGFTGPADSSYEIYSEIWIFSISSFYEKEMKMLKCSPLGEEGPVENLSEFEVIVEAATDNFFSKNDKMVW